MPRFPFGSKEGRPALVVAAAALFISLGSVGHAAVTALITGSQVKDGSLTGVDVKNGTIVGADVKDGSLTGVDIKDSSIAGRDIVNGSLSGTKITPGSANLGIFPESIRPAAASSVYTKTEVAGMFPMLGMGLSENASRLLAFTHTSTVDNTSGSATCIDQLGLNGNPEANLVVTHRWNLNGESGGVYLTKDYGVYYETVENKWCIFTEDTSTMPEDAHFNVIAFGTTPIL